MGHDASGPAARAALPPTNEAARSRSPKSPAKTVSFASTVNFSLELKPTDSKDHQGAVLPDLSELFLLALLLALALLAPAGQAIAHVNDIILLYVGYSVISFLFHSPYSPVSGLVSGGQSCSRRAQRKRRVCSA
jgi:hypothetical protein